MSAFCTLCRYRHKSHASGHRARLDRKTLTDLCRFGDPTYAKEELVAEMGAAYLSGLCGIAPVTLATSAAYLQSWMTVLRHDPTMLVQAAAQAQRAADYLQNLHPATDTEDRRAGRDARCWVGATWRLRPSVPLC